MHVVGGGGDIFGIQSAVLGKPYDIPFSGKASWLYAGEAAAAFIAAVSSDGEGAAYQKVGAACRNFGKWMGMGGVGNNELI